MIVHHKARRTDNNEEVIGFLTKMWGQYHIIAENDENTAFPIDENTITPCFDEIISSDNLTSEEASNFMWLLRKAQGNPKSDITTKE